MGVTRQDLEALAAAGFPGREVAAILSILDAYGAQAWEPERERVQRAILTLAQGDEDKLRKYVAMAKTDYRDVLMAAEYPSSPAQGEIGRAHV